MICLAASSLQEDEEEEEEEEQEQEEVSSLLASPGGPSGWECRRKVFPMSPSQADTLTGILTLQFVFVRENNKPVAI